MTHVLSSEMFMNEVDRRIGEIDTTKQHITLIALDFDNFNYVNDLYGYEVGDRVLKTIGNHFETVLNEGDTFCKLHADHFLVCLCTGDLSAASRTFLELTDLKQILEDTLPPHHTLAASGGLLAVEDSSAGSTALFDRANAARKTSKGSTGNTFHIYDKRMDEAAQWKKQVTCMMEIALNNAEFEMHLQPKVFFKTGEIVGAEALVRWNSPEYGMIYPDRFIPILEQNGFIRQLDFFMLDQACLFLADNQKKGLPVLPISVNFSKSHLRATKLVERIFKTVNNRGISTSLIEIEFTENLLSENTQQLISIVSDLKLLGFRVSIDDFGSAYSSLSYLKDLPIDIVKIDKGFLDSSTDTDRGKIIIAKVVELIKSLRMLSVMEGVETEEQVHFLEKLSCDIGQGYFYAKPMSKDDYLNYLDAGTIMEDIQKQLAAAAEKQPEKSYLNVIPQEFQMDNWELYTLGKNIDMGLMKGYLDGEATVQYINDRALEYLGYTRQEFREIFHNSIVAFTHPDDAATVQKNAEQLVATGKPLEFTTRAFRKDGKVIVLKGRSSCVIDNQGRPVGIYAFQDVTEELERTAELKERLESKISELEATVTAVEKAKEELRLGEERYRIIVEQGDDIAFEWNFDTDAIMFSDKYEAIFGYSPALENITSNLEVVERIHPDDLSAFNNWILSTYRKSGRSKATFRIITSYGTYLWTSCRSTAICDQNGVPVRAIGVFSDIQTQKQLMDDLKQRAELDPLTNILNKVECQNQINTYLSENPQKTGALFMIDVDNFKDINDNLGHQLGDSVLQDVAVRIQQIFPETGIVGRIGGDEFVVFLPDADEALASKKAEELTQSLRLSYFGSTSKYEISSSIGIALFSDHGHGFDELFHCADISLYDAKRSGKNRYVVYHENISASLIDRRNPVEYTPNFLSTYFQNDITFQVFSMLYETEDVPASVQMILEILGKRFEVDRTYMYEVTDDGNSLHCLYEWCGPGIAPQAEAMRNIKVRLLDDYFELYSKEGVLCCEDVTKSIPVIVQHSKPDDVKSLLHCAVYDENKFIGFIGFDHCRGMHSWSGDEIAVLGYISRVLSVFMAKSTITDLLKAKSQK